jgi:type I restriction enzyme R subunit
MSNFAFLQTEWPDLHEAAGKAEALANGDARAACFYARRTLELAVHWLYRSDLALKLPYQENLSALLHEPTFKQVAGDAVTSKARVINTLGNRAVHGPRSIPVEDALVAVLHAVEVAVELEVLAGREVEVQQRVMRQIPDAPACRARIARHLLPQHLEVARRRADERGQHAQQGALARAVGPGQRHALAGGEVQVDAIHGTPLPVRVHQAARADDGLRRRPPRR